MEITSLREYSKRAATEDLLLSLDRIEEYLGLAKAEGGSE